MAMDLPDVRRCKIINIKMKIKLSILIILMNLNSKTFCQSYKNEDSLIHWRASWINEYPKSIKDSNQSVFAICQVIFKKGNIVDTIIVHNTVNLEVRSLIVGCIKKIDFTKFSKQTSSIVIPYVFKNGYNIESLNLEMNLSENALENLFIAGKKRFSTKILKPIYVVDYSNRGDVQLKKPSN
jgi:hypothetical protein